MDDIAIKVAEVDHRSRSNTHRIDKLEERQDHLDRLVATVATLASEQCNIKDDVKEIKADVKCLNDRPAKRWDAVIAAIIAGVVGYLIGVVLRGGA